MDILFYPLFQIARIILYLYSWAVIIYVVMGWLELFEIINRYNPMVYNLSIFFHRLVEPALEKVRRYLPAMGTIDLSPMILLLAVMFLQLVLDRIMTRFI